MRIIRQIFEFKSNGDVLLAFYILNRFLKTKEMGGLDLCFVTRFYRPRLASICELRPASCLLLCDNDEQLC